MQTIYDYDWLSDLIAELNLSASAAHVHGSLLGYLCAGGAIHTHVTLDEALSQEHDGMPAPPAPHAHWIAIVLDEHDLELPDGTEIELDGFAQSTAKLLAQGEMRLELLLPDDTNEISVRADMLTEWCSGFLGGLGLGGFNQEMRLSKDAREGLRDLERIARTEIELDDDAEGNETALMELSEYAKVTALTLYLEIAEIAAKARPKKPALAAHRTVQ
jgi:uncharacterized protein